MVSVNNYAQYPHVFPDLRGSIGYGRSRKSIGSSLLLISCKSNAEHPNSLSLNIRRVGRYSRYLREMKNMELFVRTQRIKHVFTGGRSIGE